MSSVGGGGEKTSAKNNSSSNEPIKPTYNKYGLEFNDVKNKQEQVYWKLIAAEINLGISAGASASADAKIFL